MKIQKAFKYMLKPNVEQKEKFAKFAGSSRFVFNFGLSVFKKAFDEKTKLPTYADLANQLPLMKRTESMQWLKEVHSQVLQQSLKNLESAVQNFWRRIQSKKGVGGFPRFKKKGVHESFRYPQGVKLSENTLFLPKIGYVRYKHSRPIEGVIKQVTIVRECERWFASIQCEVEKDIAKAPLKPDRAVGIDLGLKYFAALSTGKVIDNPRYLKQHLKKLARAQRQLSQGQGKQ
jgi:putative transposase